MMNVGRAAVGRSGGLLGLARHSAAAAALPRPARFAGATATFWVGTGKHYECGFLGQAMRMCSSSSSSASTPPLPPSPPLSSAGLDAFVDTLTPFGDVLTAKVGRSWRAAELRIKSDEDLWKLWFVLLKERNMLESERIRLRALGAPLFTVKDRLKKVRHSQARVKLVTWERKLALDNAEGRTPSKKKLKLKAIKKIKKKRAAARFKTGRGRTPRRMA